MTSFTLWAKIPEKRGKSLIRVVRIHVVSICKEARGNTIAICSFHLSTINIHQPSTFMSQASENHTGIPR